MANLFTFFDNGTWEASPIDTANQNYSSSSGSTLTLSSDFAYAGTKSGRSVIPSNIFDPTILMNPVFQDRILSSFNRRVVALTVGKRYKVKCMVYTPSGQPLGSDALPITFSPRTIRAGYAADIFVSKTVAQCKDAWQEISWEFTYDGDIAFSFTHIVAVKTGTTSNQTPITPAGTVANGGKAYFDNFSLDEVVICTIGYDNPAFSKTDETGTGLNDGTITVFAHTTNGPLQYRLGAGAWQLSNYFTGLPPATYSVDIKDTSSCTASTINVTILPYAVVPPPAGGTLVIDEQPVNNYNFVSWFGTTGDTGFDKVDCINHHWDLPRPYEEIRKKQNHAFVVAQNEYFTFYINYDTPIPSATDFSKLRLGLATNVGIINLNLAQLQKDVNDDGSYNLYSTALITGAVTAGQNYFMVIYNVDTFDVYWASNRMEIMTAEDAKTYTARLQYRHSNNIYKYYFLRLPSLVLQIRMRFAMIEEQPEATIQQYRAASSGQLRNVSFDADKLVKFETYYFDVHGVRGMYMFQVCETTVINDKAYILKTPYKTSWSTKGMNVHKGVIEFFEQEFSTQNKYGGTGVTIIGSDDSFLQADNGNLIKI